MASRLFGVPSLSASKEKLRCRTNHRTSGAMPEENRFTTTNNATKKKPTQAQNAPGNLNLITDLLRSKISVRVGPPRQHCTRQRSHVPHQTESRAFQEMEGRIAGPSRRVGHEFGYTCVQRVCQGTAPPATRGHGLRNRLKRGPVTATPTGTNQGEGTEGGPCFLSLKATECG